MNSSYLDSLLICRTDFEDLTNIEHNFKNEVLPKIEISKNTIERCTNGMFLEENYFQKDSADLWHWKLTLKTENLQIFKDTAKFVDLAKLIFCDYQTNKLTTYFFEIVIYMWYLKFQSWKDSSCLDVLSVLRTSQIRTKKTL